MVFPPNSDLHSAILQRTPDAGLPDVYLLTSQHPFRNPAFTRGNAPDGADKTGFRDFVALVTLSNAFMTDWKLASDELEVPAGTPEDVRQDGQPPLHIPFPTALKLLRLARNAGRRHLVGSQS